MTLQSILKPLYAAGVRTIEIEYSGEGDSGAIDELNLLPNLELFALKKESRDAIEQRAYDILQSHFGGWEINEGSQGTITMTLTREGNAKYVINHQENYMSHNNRAAQGIL